MRRQTKNVGTSRKEVADIRVHRAAMTRMLFFLALCPLLSAAEPVTHIYKKAADRELKLNAFNPPDWKASDSRPAIVF